MVTYHLSQADDGRITLDRECHGLMLKSITVSEPETIRREINGEMVEVPQYWQSYARARDEVDGDFMHVRGEGYFARRE